MRGPCAVDPDIDRRERVVALAALEEIEPQLLEIAGEAGGEQPLPLVARLEAVGRVLRPVEAERLAELGVGAGQLDLVDADLAAQGRRGRSPPFSSNRRTIRRAISRGAPSSSSLLAQAAGLGRAPRSEADRRPSRRAWRGPAAAGRPARPASCRGCGDAEQSAMCSCSPRRGLVEQLQPDLLGNVGRRRARPTARPCRTAARRRGRRRRPGRSDAPSSSVSEKGAMMPSRLTKRLATLVAMISLRSRWREDRVAHARFCICCGKAANNSRLQGRIVGELARLRSPPAAASSRSTAGRRARAGSGRRFSWARRSSSSLLSSPSTARLSRPLSSRISMTRTSCGSARAPPRLGDRQSERLQAIVLEHDRGDLVGHLGEQQIALLQLEPALDHLAVERDLDVDLIVRAIDAGAIVDEVGVDPAAVPAELDPAGLGDGEIGALADRLDPELGGVDPDRVVAGIADLGTGSRSSP